jgi:chemotaxis protein histidine kinase CheA
MSNSDPVSEVSLDIVNEFRDSLEDSCEMVKREIARLDLEHDNKDAINALFRALHNIKGNARMCMLERMSQYGHHIENLIGEVRDARLPYIRELGEIVLLVLDELNSFVEQFIKTRQFDEPKLREIEVALEALCTTTPDTLVAHAQAVIARITGRPPAVQVSVVAITPTRIQPLTQHTDLIYFHDLALRLHARLPHASGRIERTLPLLLKLNAAAPRPVDAAQLEAALYLHDIGLAFLPDSVLCKDGQYTEAESALVKQHPDVAAALLKRIPGWEDAAKIVAQHHAWSDGTEGYPLRVQSEALHVGAQMLALVDYYESMTLPRPDRQFRRSVLTAMMEINKLAGRQFSAELAPIFIAIVRDRVKSQPA